jgi:hypothetical protein
MVSFPFSKAHGKREINLGPLKHSFQRTHVRWSRYVVDEGDHLLVSLDRHYTSGSVFSVPHHGDDGIRVAFFWFDAEEEKEGGIGWMDISCGSPKNRTDRAYRLSARGALGHVGPASRGYLL